MQNEWNINAQTDLIQLSFWSKKIPQNRWIVSRRKCLASLARYKVWFVPWASIFIHFVQPVCAQFTRSRRLRDDIEQRNHPQQESRRCNRCRRAGGPVRDNSKITTWLQKCQQRTSFKDSQQIISRRSNATGMSRDRFWPMGRQCR